MGNSLLHKSRAGNFGIDDFIHVVAGRVDNILDDIRIKIEMLQIKELIIVLIGIPTSILAVTGIIAAARQLVKFLKELRELREKD
jgi:hypothetical protein